MEFIPAIDILHGQCVRLLQGDRQRVTVYHEDPLQIAHHWRDQGAKRLHIVNLDGAFGAANDNSAIVREIILSETLPVQLGGGIRTLDQARSWMDMGVSRIILGTIAIGTPALLDEMLTLFSPERIIVGLDARGGHIAIRGWEQVTSAQLLPTAQALQARGVLRIIYTDISRDGALTGPDLAGTRQLCEKTQLKIIASGGFANLDHLKALCQLPCANLEGAVLGKALYENKVSFMELSQLMKTME